MHSLPSHPLIGIEDRVMLSCLPIRDWFQFRARHARSLPITRFKFAAVVAVVAADDSMGIPKAAGMRERYKNSFRSR